MFLTACVRALINRSSPWNNTWRRRQQILKTGSAFQNDQMDAEKERGLFLSQPGWLLSGGLTAEFLSKWSPSWQRLAWESIFKCRDLNLNGWLKQSQEDKSRGCFSGAEWGASSSHSLSLKNSFAPKRINRILLFVFTVDLWWSRFKTAHSLLCKTYNSWNFLFGKSISLFFLALVVVEVWQHE